MKKLLGAACAVVLASGVAWGQAQAPAILRTADGKPDLSGVWQTGGISLTGGAQGNVVQPGAAAPAAGARGGGGPAGGARGGGAATPGGAAAGGRGAGGGRGGGAAAQPGALPTQPTLQDWAAAKTKGLRNIDDPTVHCYPPGVPRVVGMPMPFEIVQTPGKIVILYEAFHTFRIIPTDGKKPVLESLPSYNGTSVGRWEGDTLVVDVSNFNGKIWGPGAMRITSDKYHVVERYTRTADTITYEATISDPEVLTGPFVYRSTFRRPPDTQVAEYICLENNIYLENIVN